MLTKKVLHKLAACFMAGLALSLIPLNEKNVAFIFVGAMLLGCWLIYRE